MRRRSSGFTLIEVLVVVAMMGLILVMIAQGLRVGLRGADSFYRTVQMQSDMEPVERALRRMIERMDPGRYPEPPLVRGSARALVFTTEISDPATGGNQTADVRLEADDGYLISVVDAAHAWNPFNGPPPLHREMLLDGVATPDISYAARGAGTAWLSSWDQPTLPALVRLRVVAVAGGRAWPPIITCTEREQPVE